MSIVHVCNCAAVQCVLYGYGGISGIPAAWTAISNMSVAISRVILAQPLELIVAVYNEAHQTSTRARISFSMEAKQGTWLKLTKKCFVDTVSKYLPLHCTSICSAA